MSEESSTATTPLITSAEQQRIVLEEKLRSEIREVIARSKPKQKGIFGLMANDGFKWLMGAIAIPLATFLWTQYEKERATTEAAERATSQKAELDRREKIAVADRSARERIETAQRNVSLAIQFIPSLNKAVGDPERRFALSVLRSLREEGGLPTYVHAAYEEAIEQIRSAPNSAAVLADRESATPRVLAKDPQGPGLHLSASAPIAVGNIAFIQIFEEVQREAAEKLRKILRAVGVAAPGIENVRTTRKKQESPTSAGTYRSN